MIKPAFRSMTLRELAAWVSKHNFIDGVSQFDEGELSTVDNLSDEEERYVREEYEDVCEQLFDLHRFAD